jgi:hypothetical protein
MGKGGGNKQRKDLFGRLGKRPWTAFITMLAFWFFTSGTMAKSCVTLQEERKLKTGKKNK